MIAPGASPPVVSLKWPCGVRSMRSTGQRSTTEPPLASMPPSSASMKLCASMMPVEGEISAATQDSSGSRSRAALPPMYSRSVTPFFAAVSLKPMSLGSWLSCVATSSLPQRRCATPCSAQNR